MTGCEPKRRRRGQRRYGTGPQRRLARKEDFEFLLREGSRRSLSGFTFYVRQRSEGPPRLGILVSRRHSKLAVVRNRMKRCIREAFRLEQERIGSVDMLVRPPYAWKPDARTLSRLRELLCKVDR